MSHPPASEHAATDCAASLAALARGDLRAWHGLVMPCPRTAAESAFGPSEPGPDGAGSLGGVTLAFRQYPPTAAAPAGTVVWFDGDDVLVVEIAQPALPEAVETQLGPPEETARSGLKAFHTQLIYAGRGLTVHVDDDSRDPFRLFAYAPTTVAEFLASPLATLQTHRTPLAR